MDFNAPLTVTDTAIAGLQVLTLSVRGDHRGWFKENWQRQKINQLSGVTPALRAFRPVQHNVSFNAEAGVTRGLHAEPWDKLVSVTYGEVFAAWCDLRAGSPTFGTTVWLTIDPSVAVFVPRGVANGFQALTPTSYSYLVTAHWSPDASYSHVNLGDPQLGIPWPIPLDQAVLSDADHTHPLLVDATPVPPHQIAIIGGGGQVATALAEALPTAEVFTRADLNINADYATIRDFCDWSRFDTIINAAAYTQVDVAETERLECWATNALGAAAVARLATDFNLTLIHFSSDYVFDGTSDNYTETAACAPLNVYGASKAAGDIAVMGTAKHYILRTSWVIGSGKNFVTTMLHLAGSQVQPTVVDDQFGRLTFSTDLAHAVTHLLETQPEYGIYNVTGNGDVVSWADIAEEVFTLAGADPARVTRCSTAEYTMRLAHPVATRPANSALSLAKIEATGFQPASWRESLGTYVAKQREKER